MIKPNSTGYLMRATRWSATLGLVLACSTPLGHAATASGVANKTVQLVTTEYPPYMSEKAPGQGLVIRVATAALNRSGYEVKVSFLPWARALDMTKAGAVDGIVGVWYSAERTSYLQYANPVSSTRLGLFKRVDNPITFTTLAELKPYTIGVVRGYANPPVFDDAHLRTEEASDDETNLRKLAGKRVQFVLIEKGVAQGLLNSVAPQLKNQVVWMEPAVNVMPLYVAFSRNAKNHDELANAFNQGLETLKKDGSLARWSLEAGV